MRKDMNLKIIVVITFIFMMTMNSLANIIPINGLTTGEVSDIYFNLFAPAGFTFIIWLLIYILLTIFTVYQLRIKDIDGDNKNIYLDKIRMYFSLSSVANGIWIVAWHYKQIPLSLLLIVFILICLIKIMYIMDKLRFNKMENIGIKLPFNVYFGWITIAVTANIFTLFVYAGIEVKNLSIELGTSIVITLTLIIVLLVYLKFRSLAYNFVVLWAYYGILAKHLPSGQFKGLYGLMINTVSMVIAILLIFTLYEIMKRIKKDNKIELNDYKDQ